MHSAGMLVPLKRLNSAPNKRVVFGDKMRHWKFEYAAIDKDWPSHRGSLKRGKAPGDSRRAFSPNWLSRPKFDPFFRYRFWCGAVACVRSAVVAGNGERQSWQCGRAAARTDHPDDDGPHILELFVRFWIDRIASRSKIFFFFFVLLLFG